MVLVFVGTYKNFMCVEQNEGSMSFRQAWVHYKDSSPIKHEAERLPPPVVADLNGDGHVEVIVALEDKLQVNFKLEFCD